MNKKHNIRKVCIPVAVAITAVMAVACSDWGDHYAADNVAGSANSTIWENIVANENMSQFRALALKAGYDSVLNAPNSFTAWIPADGTFNYDSINNLGNDKLLREFLQNHIAKNNISASGAVDKKVLLLNDKFKEFKGFGSYTMGGVQVLQPNILSTNGVIHLTTGRLPFFANIYEMLSPEIHTIDSVAGFYHSYDVRKLDLSKSTEGPLKDGERTYLDSVYTETNDLYRRYNALINAEDSNYTMLVPTNKAWTKAKEAIVKYYNYVPNFTFLANTAATAASGRVEQKVSINAEYLLDSITNRNIMKDLFFNNNLYDNSCLESLQNGQKLEADSLVTTGGTKLMHDDAAMLFANVMRSEASNGTVFYTDNIGMQPWLTWNPIIRIEGEATRYVSYSNQAVISSPRVTAANRNLAVPGKLSNNMYASIAPLGSQSNPEVDYYLPNVRSTEYNIYIVFVPTNITNVYDTLPKPSKLRLTIGYNDEKGKVKELRGTDFVTNANKIDTMLVGNFTFPIAYYGTGNYYPYIRINERSKSRERDLYSRTFGVDCILLVPKELDEYMKEHPEYTLPKDY